MSQAIQLIDERTRQVSELRFSGDQLELLKATVAKGTTDEQFALFCEVAQRTGLNPFAKQIYAVLRNTKQGDKWVPTMTIQTGVDGYRLIAQRTGEYAGQRGPQWCGEDGDWRDVWLSKQPPAAARVGVYRTGFMEPVWGVATMQSYLQTDREGRPMGLWKTMPDVMIAKCAEVLALRKAFPQELSGLYADAEMDQADGGSGLVPAERPATQAPPKRGAARQSQAPVGDDDAIEGEAREIPSPRASHEPPISQFWRDVRGSGITREQVVAHLGHEQFEELDSDQLGELLIQLREKHAQPALGV